LTGDDQKTNAPLVDKESRELTRLLRQMKRDIRYSVGEIWWSWIQKTLDEPLTHLLSNVGIGNIAPESRNWFRALEATPLNKVRVVILGQEPYYQPGYSDGLAFSRSKAWDENSALKNIFRELKSDLGIDAPKNNGSLMPWAKQGVLLLNTAFTVEVGKPGSGTRHGWEQTASAIIQAINHARQDNVVWILLGKEAQAYVQSEEIKGHIIRAAHPSPQSAHRGFFFSKIFSTANGLLRGQPIDWSLEERK